MSTNLPTAGQSDETTASTPLTDSQLYALLLLAPKDLFSQIVQAKDISMVTLQMVKKGTYNRKTAWLVVLDVQLASDRLESFEFHVNFLLPKRPQPPSPVPITATATQPVTISNLWETFSGRASERLAAVRDSASALWRKSQTGYDYEPSAGDPQLVLAGPSRVFGPMTKITTHETTTTHVEPKVGNESAQVELGFYDHTLDLQYVSRYAPAIHVWRNVVGGVHIKATAPRLGGSFCPVRFRVGLVVQHPDPINMEVKSASKGFSTLFDWDRPSTTRLVDDTEDGERQFSLTCSNDICGKSEERKKCRAFDADHMTEDMWKAKLIGPIRSWDLPRHDQEWVTRFRE